jgi:hypothetical protein
MNRVTRGKGLVGHVHTKKLTAIESTVLADVTAEDITADSIATGVETISGSTTSAVGNGTDLSVGGMSIITSTDGAKYYDLPAPAAGLDKVIVASAGSTDNTMVVYTASGVTFDGTNNTATFNAADDALVLKARSATRWQILVNNGSVALSSST